MVRASRKPAAILSNSEREDLLENKRELEDTLKEKQEYGQGTQATQIDEGAIKGQIRRIENALEAGAVPRVTGKTKDELAKEAEDIERQLQEGMPTRDEMDHPGPRNPNAVHKHMRWSARNQALIERYRYIQRIINPDEPKSIESLRREK